MARTLLKTLLLAASAACLGGCLPQPPQAGSSSPAAYIGRPIAAFIADHGQPGLEVKLSDKQMAFTWDTVGHDIGPAIGTGLAVRGGPPPSLLTMCTVTLIATTQVAKPGPNDWMIQGWDRQGC